MRLTVEQADALRLGLQAIVRRADAIATVLAERQASAPHAGGEWLIEEALYTARCARGALAVLDEQAQRETTPTQTPVAVAVPGGVVFGVCLN